MALAELAEWSSLLRWLELVWFSGTHRRAIGVGATLVSCVLIIGVAPT